MFGDNSADDDISTGIAIATEDGRVWTFGNPSDEEIAEAKRIAQNPSRFDLVAGALVEFGIAAVILLAARTAYTRLTTSDE